MTGNVVQLVGLSLALAWASPALFHHPFSSFLGMRLAVGLMMGVAIVGMVVFLVDHQLVAFFVLACLCGALGYAGAWRLLQLMHADARMRPKARKKRDAKLQDISQVGGQWFIALLLLAGFVFSVAQSRP